MHGELMEFNEILHRQLNNKEFQLKRMKQELTDLRGPVWFSHIFPQEEKCID